VVEIGVSRFVQCELTRLCFCFLASFLLFSGLGGVGSNSVGLQVNGLDLCMVHKDFPYAP
jgi:hypothetical protein